MLKNRQLYIPHYGRDRCAYDIVNNYLSDSFSKTMSYRYFIESDSIRFLEAEGHKTSRFLVIYKNSGEGHFDRHKIWLRCDPAFPLRNLQIKS